MHAMTYWQVKGAVALTRNIKVQILDKNWMFDLDFDLDFHIFQ